MHGWIGHLRCQIHVPQAAGGPAGSSASYTGAAAARLMESVARHLEDSFDQALETALDGDPAVYVLRSVRVSLPLDLSAPAGDAALAQRWSARLAGAVVREVMRGDSEEVIRFDDQAAYVACFIIDLLDGLAWTRWYYGAFAALRVLDLPAALRSLLLDERERLAEILAQLWKEHRLEALLRVLGQVGARDLLRAADPNAAPGRGEAAPMAEPVMVGSEAVRPLFAAALNLAARMGMGQTTQPTAALAAYLAGRPMPADWRDPRSLADAVADALAFLMRGGGLPGRLSLSSGDIADRLAPALGPLDWLDRERLAARVRESLAVPGEPAFAGEYGGPGVAITPRQKALLADLLAALERVGHTLDDTNPASPANALRLLAGLAAGGAPRTLDGPAGSWILRLLAAWEGLACAPRPEAVLAFLRRGDLEGALLLLPSDLRAGAAAGWRLLLRLGDPGQAVLEKLAARVSERPPEPFYPRYETPRAGAALLLRALQDLRLPSLAGPRLTAAILACLGGPGDDPHDQALALLCGAEKLDDSPLDRPAFDAGWLRALAGQRLIEGEELRLYELPWAGDRLLVAGDSSGLFPLSCVIQAPDDPEEILRRWLSIWPRENPRLIHTGEAGEDLSLQQERLDAILTAFGEDPAGSARPGFSLALLGECVLRQWARWLRGFAESSTAYLLKSFIRRAGTVEAQPGRVLVALDPLPLDVALQMIGYFDPLERVSWLNGRRVEFNVRGKL